MFPCLVLGFWDEDTGICAGAMPHRRDVSGPLPGSRHVKLNSILPAVLCLAWIIAETRIMAGHGIRETGNMTTIID